MLESNHMLLLNTQPVKSVGTPSFSKCLFFHSMMVCSTLTSLQLMNFRKVSQNFWLTVSQGRRNLWVKFLNESAVRESVVYLVFSEEIKVVECGVGFTGASIVGFGFAIQCFLIHYKLIYLILAFVWTKQEAQSFWCHKHQPVYIQIHISSLQQAGPTSSQLLYKECFSPVCFFNEAQCRAGDMRSFPYIRLNGTVTEID